MCFDNSKIIVVGGAGFVGANLVKQLLTFNIKKIIIIDNLLSSEQFNIPNNEKIEFWNGSITNNSILNKIKDEYEYIFHLATFHGNQNSIHDPLADHENNTLTTLKLFLHIQHFKILKRVVYTGAGCAVAAKDISSDATATKEDTPVPLDMDSPYSISKIIGEYYSVYFHKHSNLPVVRARFQNVYGPGEILGAGEWRGTYATVWRNVVPTFIYKSLQKHALHLENNGESSRDFIYVDDICMGLIKCANKGIPGDVYNLSSGCETTISELAETINQLTKNPTPCEYKPRRGWDHSIKRFGCPQKSHEELEFKTEIDLFNGLKKTIEWTNANLNIIEKTIKKHTSYIS